MLDNVRQCWTMPDNVGQCWTMLDNAGQCWTMLDDAGQWPCHGDRFTVNGSGFMVKGSWFTVHGSRFKSYSLTAYSITVFENDFLPYSLTAYSITVLKNHFCVSSVTVLQYYSFWKAKCTRFLLCPYRAYPCVRETSSDKGIVFPSYTYFIFSQAQGNSTDRSE